MFGDDLIPLIEQEIKVRSGKRERDEIRFLCPAHDDHHPSARWNPAKEVWTCDVCGAGGGRLDLADRFGIDIQSRKGGEGGVSIPPETRAMAQCPTTGLGLKEYSEAKRLSMEYLLKLGLSDFYYMKRPAVRMPYKDIQGVEQAVQFRIALTGDDRFRWRKGSRPRPYGEWLLPKARKYGHVVLVEGASDCHTCWSHGVPALGLPGANTFKEDFAPLFDGFERIFFPMEPDNGGEKLFKALTASSLADRIHILDLGAYKDVSDLHIAGEFKERWSEIIEGAVPLQERLAVLHDSERAEAWRKCEDLAASDRILDNFIRDLQAHGVVGEETTAKVLFLSVTGRFLDRLVSVAVKGPSSAGKSYVTEEVLKFFPESAYYPLSSMSERSLIYSEESLKHRFLVLYEASGMSSDFATYLLRSLLSEGRVRYETVEKTTEGMKPRLIEREGPSGLIVTTTEVNLHPENETRMLSLTVTDTREQTKAILLALADEEDHPVDLEAWHALHDWLSLSECRVTIPFASTLAGHIPPLAVRLRRDFRALLSLIKAHAILHQANRQTDSKGRIVATFEDYGVVRKLALNLISEGVRATVSDEVRETVAAVEELKEEHPTGVKVADLAKHLDLDHASAWRRAGRAIDADYLGNLETKKNRPWRLVMGDSPLPEDIDILPEPKELRDALQETSKNESKTETSEDIDEELVL